MSLTQVVSSRSRIASPFGTIPMDFPRMGDLCRVAHVRYDDKEVKDKDGSSLKYRVWRVVTDDGKAGENVTTTQFKKFCMLLDWLTWKHPSLSRNEILEMAILELGINTGNINAAEGALKKSKEAEL